MIQNDTNEIVDTLIERETEITSGNGKVANFSYTTQAYEDDDYAGVDSYSFNQEQNIPSGRAEIMNLNETNLAKGFRSQASSLPRMTMNHFFGRCSYNLNKAHDWLLSLLNITKRHLAQDMNLYSATQTYYGGDCCFVLAEVNGKASVRFFRCITESEEGITNTPPLDDEGTIDTVNWSEINGAGKPNGVATLDADGRIPFSQAPESAVELKGEWDASTNTPTLADGVGTNGDMYYVSVGGMQTFGGKTENYLAGDRIMYDGVKQIWFRLPAGTVKTVNNQAPDANGNVSIALNVFNTIYPVGSPYVQYPGFASPNDLWGNMSTWEEVNFGGVFFRSSGGDAKPFLPPFAVSVSDAGIISLSESRITEPEEVNIGDLVIVGEQYRTITAINGDTAKRNSQYTLSSITVDTPFADYTNITTVLIGQHEGLPNITGKIQNKASVYSFNWTGSEGDGAFEALDMALNSVDSRVQSSPSPRGYKINASKGETKADGTLKNDVYGKSDHLQTNNITVKYWKRVA